MRTTLTAAAYLAFAMMGAAFAEEPQQQAVNTVSVLESIYGVMDKDRAEAQNAVVANAEDRLEAQFAALDTTSEPAPAITIASN